MRAAPLPPRLFNVAVRYSALDGTNFTDVKTSTEVAESLFTGNRGEWFRRPRKVAEETKLDLFGKAESILDQ